MRINVTSNAGLIKLKVRNLGNDVSVGKGKLNVLLRAIGRKSRDQVRKNITGQVGFEKLSKWTRAKTGRRKSLLPLRKMITFRLKPKSVEVGIVPISSEWNATKHHRGFNNPPEGRVVLNLKNPRALKVSGQWFSFNDTKGSDVPARPIWGISVAPYARIAGNESVKWMNGILAKRK